MAENENSGNQGISLEDSLKKLFKEGNIPALITELDIWKVIESLGAYIFRTEHDACDARISLGKKDEELLQNAKDVSRLLVHKLKEFNVIPPDEYPECEIGQKLPPAPKGKIYYWDWYRSMSAEYYRSEFENIICSACPYREKNAAEVMQSHIPCDLVNGMIYHLNDPWECGMLRRGSDGLTEKQLFRKIRRKGGEDALKRFKQKRLLLKSKKSEQ